MPSDLEYKLGDVTKQIIAPKGIAISKQMQVSVERHGIEVRVVIGNADPLKFTYEAAMRQAQAWGEEGTAAIRQQRSADLHIGHKRASLDGRNLIQIAQWMMAKASEAKLLDGKHKMRIMVE